MNCSIIWVHSPGGHKYQFLDYGESFCHKELYCPTRGPEGQALLFLPASEHDENSLNALTGCESLMREDGSGRLRSLQNELGRSAGLLLTGDLQPERIGQLSRAVRDYFGFMKVYFSHGRENLA